MEETFFGARQSQEEEADCELCKEHTWNVKEIANIEKLTQVSSCHWRIQTRSPTSRAILN